MKTIKIPEELHQDLMMIKIAYKFKTIGQAIRFLQLYWKENIKNTKMEIRNDKK